MPSYLTTHDVELMHHVLIEQYGGSSGIRDYGLPEAAIYRPQSGYYGDIYLQAAALFASLITNHPFVDGNKRIAFAATDVFLRGIRSSIIDGAKVINASIGGSYYSKLEEDTYKLADSLGAVVVAAAGNSNSNNDYQPVYPASYETVLSVAATDKTDSIASFSNYGESVDISAPGSQIPSTMNNQSYLAQRLPLNFVKNITEDHGIWLLSGTSMATPHDSLPFLGAVLRDAGATTGAAFARC